MLKNYALKYASKLPVVSYAPNYANRTELNLGFSSQNRATTAVFARSLVTVLLGNSLQVKEGINTDTELINKKQSGNSNILEIGKSKFKQKSCGLVGSVFPHYPNTIVFFKI